MNIIKINTQAELDALPKSFDECTQIQILGGTIWDRIVVRFAWENSSVVAWGNSSVVAWGNSSVEAWGNSSVVAWGNSSVEAWENSSVVAWGNSSVEARENSSVEARENSSVEAWENSSIKVFSSYTDIKKIKQEAVAIFIDCKPVVKEVDNKEHLIYTKQARHDIDSFITIHKLEVKKNKVILFKSVHPDTLCDFRTGTIKYEGIVKCPDFDPNPEIECGYGLHLSPTEKLALSFNVGKILKCEVDLKDIVVYHGNIDKVRCKKVKVLTSN